MVNGLNGRRFYLLFTIYHLPRQKPRAKQRGACQSLFVSPVKSRLAELFSRLFYVAASRLNSPRLIRQSLKHRTVGVSSHKGQRRPKANGIFHFPFYGLALTISHHATRNLPRLIRPSHKRTPGH